MGEDRPRGEDRGRRGLRAARGVKKGAPGDRGALLVWLAVGGAGEDLVGEALEVLAAARTSRGVGGRERSAVLSDRSRAPCAKRQVPQRAADAEVVGGVDEVVAQVVAAERAGEAAAAGAVVDLPVGGLVGEVAEHAAGQQGPAGGAERAVGGEQEQEQAEAVEGGGDQVLAVGGGDVVVAVDDEGGDAAGGGVGAHVEEAAVQRVLDEGPQQPADEHERERGEAYELEDNGVRLVGKRSGHALVVGDRLVVMNTLWWSDAALQTMPEEHYIDPSCGASLHHNASNDPAINLTSADKSLVLPMTATPFVAARARDLHLGAKLTVEGGSPSDGGLKVLDLAPDRILAPTTDMDGRPRAQAGGTISIGAYEPTP